MLFHDPVQITRRFGTPYLELALNIDYSAAWSVNGFHSEREHGRHVQFIYMNDVKIHAEMPARKAMNHMELRFNPLLWGVLLQELDIRLEQSFACMEALITPDTRAIAQELSSQQMVHINEQKLKNGFKELFGTTVFGFVRQQRPGGITL
ncbi:hypothetical protein [Paenibacillus sp. EKM212P]|uniref:hypothetical protein n=1 Tax=Paenibacillus sp. EKM212P TaxID=1683680 RepID=UPI001EEA77EF|nr:hypothetical protein [Paenibacillus sp. EKM212P]